MNSPNNKATDEALIRGLMDDWAKAIRRFEKMVERTLAIDSSPLATDSSLPQGVIAV